MPWNRPERFGAQETQLPKTLTKSATASLTMRMPQQDYDEMVKRATERGLTITEFVRQAVGVQLFLAGLPSEELSDKIFRDVVERLSPATSRVIEPD